MIRQKLVNSEEGSQSFLSLVLTEMINSLMYSFNPDAGISSTFLSSFLVPEKVAKVLHLVMFFVMWFCFLVLR